MAQELAEKVRGTQGTARTSWWELNYYTRNVLLRDTDSMSMAHGLEVRVPYLDHHLVEYVLSLPPHVVLPPLHYQAKPLLARAVADIVPEAIRRRRKKGFVLPLDEWMRNVLNTEVEQTLLRKPCPPLDGILHADAVEATWQKYVSGKESWHRPWALFVLKRWAGEHLCT
jgi:asparagine synthase (glutamine-hydrolysing)